MEKAEAFSYCQTHSLQLLTEGLAKISVEIRAALTKSNSDGVKNARLTIKTCLKAIVCWVKVTSGTDASQPIMWPAANGQACTRTDLTFSRRDLSTTPCR